MIAHPSSNYRRWRTAALEFLALLGLLAVAFGWWVALPGGPQ